MGSEDTARRPKVRAALELVQGGPHPEDDWTPIRVERELGAAIERIQSLSGVQGSRIKIASELRPFVEHMKEIADAIAKARKTRSGFFAGSLHSLQGISGATDFRKSLEEAIAKSRPDPSDLSGRSVLAGFNANEAPPVASQLVVPGGWELSSNGILDTSTKGSRMIPCPALISGVTSDDQWELCWRTVGGWTQEWMLGADARNPNYLSRRASFSQTQAKTVCNFLTDMVNVNIQAGTMPTLIVKRRAGWDFVDDVPVGYAFSGSVYISKEGVTSRAKTVVSIPPTMRGFGDAIRQGGTWEAWLETVKEHVCTRPAAYLALVAAVAGPLVTMLGAAPFTLEYSGPTSSGKSSVTALAGSTIGRVDNRRARDTVIHQWNSTLVGAEGSLSLLDLSVMDDTNVLPPHEGHIPAQVVFAFSNGSGKIRGNADGSTRAVATFAGVLITSSEQPIYTQAAKSRGQVPTLGGFFARLLTVTEPPMGARGRDGEFVEANGVAAAELETRLSRNYGHLLPRVIQHLLTRDYEQLANRHQKLKAEWAEYVNGLPRSGVMVRLSKILAVLTLAYEVLMAVGVPQCKTNPIDVALRAALMGADLAALPRKLLAALAAAYAAEPSRFGYYEQLPAQPVGGWLGFLMTRNGSRVAFLPQTLRTVGGAYGAPDVETAMRLLSELNGENIAYSATVNRAACLVVDLDEATKTGNLSEDS